MPNLEFRCTQEKEGMGPIDYFLNCQVPVANYRLKQVTGISGDGATRLVEYTVEPELTEWLLKFRVARGLNSAKLPTKVIETKRANFRRFDDGWRVE